MTWTWIESTEKVPWTLRKADAAATTTAATLKLD